MDEVHFLSIEEVVVIHDRMIEIGGGAEGIRDVELLHSALGRPKATFSGVFLYSNVFDMAAAMIQSIVKNHPFVDGNKRTAFFGTLRFFEKNGFKFEMKNTEIVDFMVRVDTQNLTVEQISVWFKKRNI